MHEHIRDRRQTQTNGCRVCLALACLRQQRFRTNTHRLLLFINLRRESQATNGNSFGRRSRAPTRPDRDLFGPRVRHSSCPERVDGRELTITEHGDVCDEQNNPLVSKPTGNSVEQLSYRLSERGARDANHEEDDASIEDADLDDTRQRTRGLKRSTCSDQARMDTADVNNEMSVDELAGYFDEHVHIPRKMSFMAELMYT